MNLLFDSFWRAVAYCLRPRVIALSILPLLLMVALSLGLGYYFWDDTLDWVRNLLDASSLATNILDWMQRLGLGNLKPVLVPLIVIFAVTPLIVLTSLLLVALMMAPALTALVAEKRFPELERKQGGFDAGGFGLVAAVNPAGPAGAGGVDSLVADPAIDSDLAAIDLGLADLPRDGI
jgi:uncharacterized protein involved in cysteine biosynthesis